jgi:predicted Fe-Mo cluster-binding NifX family protein
MMKICVPTENDQGLDAKVYGHFGSAPFLALADTETDQVEIVQNRGHHHRPGECSPASNLQPREIDAVVCAGMGKRALLSLQEAGIDVFLSKADTVRDVLAAIREKKYQRLTADEACGGRHGHHGQHGGHHGEHHGRHASRSGGCHHGD